jgi:2'-5' RNA ligase
MAPGDRLICAFAYDVEVGMTFRAWPLHITIVPWFRLALGSSELAARLQKLLKDMAPFDILIGEDTYFGYRRDKLVSLVQAPSPLEEIEQRVRGFLHQQDAWLADETTQRRRPFRPHITAQGASRVHEADSFSLAKLFVVEQEGAQKHIVAAVSLGYGS